MTPPRYAVYFAPDPASAWWSAGCAWLGRDALTGRAVAQSRIGPVGTAAFARLTANPRRYGWHATLKPPFRLAADVDEHRLRERLAALAAGLSAVPLGALAAVQLGRFIALVPQQESSALAELAARCVVDLDDLRAPPADNERARRGALRLSARERELLERYGYPYVLDRFRFHFSLTGVLDAADGAWAELLIDAARKRFDPLNTAEPLLLDRLSLFIEPAPSAALVRAGDFLLQGHA